MKATTQHSTSKVLTLLMSAVLSMTTFAQAKAQPQAETEVRDAQPMKAQPAAASSNYRLRADDVVDVKIFEEAELSGKATVQTDGTVKLHLVGDLRLAGLSTSEAANRIKAAYERDFLKNAQVTVSVSQYAKRLFTVSGQVTTRGAFAIPNNQRISLTQALAMAGGVTRLGNDKKVILKRTINGQVKVYQLNAREMASNPEAGTVYILEGDEITVPQSAF